MTNERPASLGTVAWARRSQGLLSTRDRMSLLPGLARAQATYLAGRLRLATRRRAEPLGHLDPGTVTVPDSRTAREAEEQCLEVLPSFLVEHSYRTFLWATALAQRDGIAHDAELLYVACLYHDTGLVDMAEERCFTAASAASAVDHSRRAGWDDERSNRLGDAITLHLNPAVALADGPEAHLLHAGASLDTAGIRLWHVDRLTVAAVVVAHPRLDFRRQFAALWLQQCRTVPGGRANFLRRYGAFRLAVRIAPFAE